MARTSPIGLRSQARARIRAGLALLSAIVIGLMLSTVAAGAAPVPGEASLSAQNGYARLVLKFSEDVGADVTTAGSILLIKFDRPANVPIDRWVDAAPDYISSARGDPDGSALRLSLSRKVRVNTMTAGERVFIDLLPDSWTGAPPPLPAEVVRELAERARAAEKALRLQRAEAESKKRPPIRVRALVQPTFVRFVFEIPDGVGISSVMNDQKMSLFFNAPLNFDLADAKIVSPPNVAAINQRIDGSKTVVEIGLIGEVDVHAFREEKNYNIDIAYVQPDKKVAAVSSDTLPGAKAAAADRSSGDKPNGEKPKQAAQPEIVPPTSETIAKEMKAEAKPAVAAPATEPAAEPAPAVASKAEAAPEPAKLEAAKPEAAKLEAARPEPAKSEPAKSDVVKSEAAKAEAPKMEAAKPEMAEAPKTMEKPAEKPATGAATLEALRDSEGLRLTFGFGQVTPAALFRRGDTVWMVFDSTKPVDVEPIRAKGGAIIGEVNRVALDKGQAIRIRLNRPQMHSLGSDDGGRSWTLSFADKGQTNQQPLMVMRNVTDPALANVMVPLANPGAGMLHRLTDPDAGDTLLVVTAPPPIRGFIKRQDFVDLSLLDSIHGIAVRPNSDDVAVEIAPDKVILGRPGGLTLSSIGFSPERAPTAVRPMFDIDEWQQNQTQPFVPREDLLIRTAANAEPERRAQARLALARFYMARGMYPEARGITNLMISDDDPRTDETAMLMIHAVASILMGRPDQGLKDLANSSIGNNFDSQMWKGLAFARQGKFADAREKLKNVEFAIASLPLDLQRIVTSDAMKASLEIKDFAGAAKRRAELDVIGVPADMKPDVAVLRGRLAEAMAQEKDALDEYRFAINSNDRPAAAEAKLFEIKLLQKRGEIKPADALKELETLQATWRGDAIEVQTLQMMSQLYEEAGRYADSLEAARMATRLMPNSDMARQAQDAAQRLFSQLFLSGKADELPPVDALSIFYGFRELTPIGRRGDEMIRKLADRLVGIDLLDQAAELLQYQVDHRLEGAARAQVAARLAMVYLTNRKPDRAIEALRTTRIADLSGELRQQRLLLEARANSDIGRHDLGLDIITNVAGREAIRLRSDIYWASRRWREASEQIELYYGDRWRDFRPLNPAERGDILRAVVGYALADDAIGLARFREKYAPLMTGEADKLAFDIASKPASGSSAEFAQIAKMAAGVDTLDGFLRDMKARFPDATGKGPDAGKDAAKPGLESTGALPRIQGVKQAIAGR
ncbi:tetratricopeptide repeat protein [Bradyrhizobium aeschynomenes]|uniref:tetratricopeptide repeat protein n=1 Tax=Bradyrhizobium aeschynomenes TaxID=2734909 RepID=UPI0015536BFC|nr:tetratricopeptide repeat protein [Bradyrhizobium aeschynomenes]NPV25754.1 tetratricopeptide repeat protein [Bradyrhizobium aeschynomenes]